MNRSKSLLKMGVTVYFWGLILTLLPAPQAGALEAGFWVWKADLVLNSRQQRDLRESGASELFWYVGSLQGRGGRWVPEKRKIFPEKRVEGIAYVPVWRLVPGKENPLTAEAAAELAGQIRELAGKAVFAEAQVDFDCPDRLLAEYAGFLAACRRELKPIRLSATALAGWSRHTAFGRLQESVDRLFPMFYDLEPDRAAEVLEGRVLPLLEPGGTARALESWRGCRIPWHAGLPGFARVTIFDRLGRSRGHLRQWSWDSVAFAPGLLTSATLPHGITLLRSAERFSLGETPVGLGETVACRWPELADLRQTLAAAQAAGARGVAIFRLPEGGASGGWSLPQWRALLGGEALAQPRLRLVRMDEGLVLTNDSTADLPPRLAGPAGALDRGWQVEIEAGGAAVFREASAGDFAAVHGHAHPEVAEPLHVPIALAERLTYWLADLPAGAVRRSGLLQLAPGADARLLRWRMPGSPQNSMWTPLE